MPFSPGYFAPFDVKPATAPARPSAPTPTSPERSESARSVTDQVPPSDEGSSDSMRARAGDAVTLVLLVSLTCLPLQFSTGIQLLAALVLLSREIIYQEESFAPTKRCKACRYDLAGLTLPGKCPECGVENPARVVQPAFRTKWMARPVFAILTILAVIALMAVVPATWMALYRASGLFPISFGFAVFGPAWDSFDVPAALAWCAAAPTIGAVCLSVLCPRISGSAARCAVALCVTAIGVALAVLTALGWCSGAVHWNSAQAGSWLGFCPLLGICAPIFGVSLGRQICPNLPR